MAEAAVLASGLRVARGSRDIVRGLELRIEQGQIVGLFGSNGAGKTTLLQALAGLLPTGAGQLQVLGGTASQARRRIGYVAQVVPEGAQTRLRAADFVASAWRAERWGFALSPRLRAERAAAVHEALRSTACEHLAGRGMDTLSGGERQRV